MRLLIGNLSKLLFMLCFQLICAQLLAQGGFQGNMPMDAKITGSIVDASNGQVVPYTSVAIYRAKDSTLITGVMSTFDGNFTISALPYGKFYLLTSFIGYKKQVVKNILLTPNNKIVDLGAVKIDPVSTSLKEVEVVGTKAPIAYQIDKKVIDISQNITASGGTVADALQNAPSVQTDVQGNVTLRGSSNFTVLVDGRPSPISGSEALQQIPANLVQNVEIITNPSAKYEAEGSAGIINIVMKKQKIQGGSGIFNATAGTGNKYSSNLNLTYKVSKFNFTLGGDFTDFQMAMKNNMTNIDTLSGQTIKNQVIEGDGHFHRQGWGVNGGIEYDMNDKNTLTLSGSVGSRKFSRPMTSYYYDSYLNLLNSTSTNIFYTNNSTPEFKRDYSSVNLDYLLKLDTKGQQLSASAYFTGGPDNNLSSLLVDTTDANRIHLTGNGTFDQETVQKSDETDLRTKVDYTLPIGAKGKLEAGYQGRYQNNNASFTLSNNGKPDSTRTDELNFKDQVQAGYVTFSNSMTFFDYQLGLRSEYENRLVNQEIQDKTYKVNRIDFFPTVHLTRQLPWDLQLQASYTRRINRPQTWNLDPFVVYMDPQTTRQGNAALLPEFTNSYELNLEKKLPGSSFISVESFLRQTSDLIQQISLFDPATEVTTNTFANVDHDRSIGGELMLYLEPARWFNLNTSFNVFNYHMFGTPIPSVASSTNTWNVRVNPTFHVGKLTTVQLSYSYNAPTITAQGTRSANYSSSLGIRQSLFKQKGSLTLQVRDLVGHSSFNSTTESSHQYKYSSFQRESQVVMLTFSYRINNYKAKQSTRENGGGNGDQETDQGGL
jgi:outer membrane receptor protein involved in Fe transport